MRERKRKKKRDNGSKEMWESLDVELKAGSKVAVYRDGGENWNA